MIENIPIPVTLFNAIQAYLIDQKWREVNNLVQGLDAAARKASEETQHVETPVGGAGTLG